MHFFDFALYRYRYSLFFGLSFEKLAEAPQVESGEFSSRFLRKLCSLSRRNGEEHALFRLSAFYDYRPLLFFGLSF